MTSLRSVPWAATVALLAVLAASGCTVDKSAPSGWQGGDNVRTAMVPTPTDRFSSREQTARFIPPQ